MAASSRSLIIVLLLLVAMAAVAESARTVPLQTIRVKGRKFNVVNKPHRQGDNHGPFCPEENPNTLLFCNNGTFTIFGNFAAPDLGACAFEKNIFTLKPHEKMTDEQFGDQVILRIYARVASGDSGQWEVSVGPVTQRKGVSFLTDASPANC